MRLSSRTFSIFSTYSHPPLRFLLVQFSRFSTSPNHYSFQSSSSLRRYGDESRNVKVSVWWDFENCNLPSGVNVFKVSNLITAAVRENGIKGPIQINAFGDTLQLSRANQEALSVTGISLIHIPHGGKNSADRSLLVHLMNWVFQNPPPAHLFLISGDKDFAIFLYRLRMNNYNVLIASPESAPPSVLCNAASIMWHWNALIRGENLVGKHFNRPPDGPYGSWYGHYKVPIEDSFPTNEQPSCSLAEQVSEPCYETKPRPIPKNVIWQIRYVLKRYPQGITMKELRSELGKSNISMDKDFYGYKKFSHFLLSMPHILKLQKNGDGQSIIHIVASKSVESFDTSRSTLNEASNSTGEQDLNVSAKLKDNDSLEGAMNVPHLLSSELIGQHRPKNMEQSSEFGKSIGRVMKEEPSTPPVSELPVMEVSKGASQLEAESSVPPSIGQCSETEKGFFRRIWIKFFGSDDQYSGNKNCNVSEKGCTSEVTASEKSCNGLLTTYARYSHGEAKTEEKTVKSMMNQDASSVNPVSSSSHKESAMPQKTAMVSSAYDDKLSSNPGLFGRIGQWFKFWRNDTENGKVSEQFCELNQLRNQSGKNELLSSNSFWQDMHSFMETHNAVDLILRSKTRLEMAQSLQGEGPSVLKSLSNSDVLDFVELLISEKKWVEEYPSKTKPFKLTLSTARESSCTKPLLRSNRLTSIFLNPVSQPNLQGSPGYDLDEKSPQAGVSTTVTKSKFADRTRSEILGDCQKFVNEILREYPEGFNMGGFRRMFFKRYGYHLEVQKLGYLKLASLLQIMPGVTIESTFIIPTNKVPKISNLDTILPSNSEEKVSHILTNTNSESSESSRKDDDFDSTWEELGPVSGTDCYRNEELMLRKGVEATEKWSSYEPVLSDYDLTDSDGEPLPTTRTEKSEAQKKLPINEEDSSLFQIIDSWANKKGNFSSKDQSENTDGNIDCFGSSLKFSSLSAKSEANVGSFARKQRQQKSYSFVSETDDNNQEKLIDGILGTFKKSTDSRVHH